MIGSVGRRLATLVARPSFPSDPPGSGPGLAENEAGSLLVLLALTLGVALTVDRLGGPSYALAHDLPWLGVVLSGPTLATARRGRPVTAVPWLDRVAHPGRVGSRAWGLGLVAVALLVLAPWITPHPDRGLTLRVDAAKPARAGSESATSANGRVVSGLAFGPASGAPWTEEHFSATLEGWLYAPVTGRYQFTLDADDAAVLRVDDAPVAAAGRTTEAVEVSGEAEMSAGFRRLAIAYRQDEGKAGLRLRWAPPRGLAARRIPSVFLLPDGASAAIRELSALAFGLQRVVTTEGGEAWVTRFQTIPWIVQQRDFAGIMVYETDIAPTYLLGARGTVDFDYDRIWVRLDAPADPVTLKFRWTSGLAITPALPMDPIEVQPGLQFIRVRPGGACEFQIRY
jgi:PA14 domain